VDSREMEGVRDLNDESAQGKTKLVIALKRDAVANVVLNNLWKHTPLQTSFGVNTVALVDGVPRTLNLVQALQYYIDHQVDVITQLESILADPIKRRGVIKTEWAEGREKFATPRVCQITYDDGDLSVEDLSADEPLVFTMTKAGYVKTVAADAFRTQGRGGRG